MAIEKKKHRLSKSGLRLMGKIAVFINNLLLISSFLVSYISLACLMLDKRKISYTPQAQ